MEALQVVMKKLLQDQESSDVVFEIGDIQIYAHRAILANRSDPFKVMLYGNWIESEKKIKISDPRITAEGFKTFFLYLYTNYYFYQVPPLKEVIEDFISHLRPEDSLLLLESALEHNDKEIIDQLCPVFSQDPVHAIRNVEQLPGVITVKFILENDNISASEIALFQFLVIWRDRMKKEIDQEIENPNELFELIRYCLISKDDLLTIVKPTNLAPLSLYIEAIENHLSKTTKNLYPLPHEDSENIQSKKRKFTPSPEGTRINGVSVVKSSTALNVAEKTLNSQLTKKQSWIPTTPNENFITYHFPLVNTVHFIRIFGDYPEDTKVRFLSSFNNKDWSKVDIISLKNMGDYYQFSCAPFEAYFISLMVVSPRRNFILFHIEFWS